MGRQEDFESKLILYQQQRVKHYQPKRAYSPRSTHRSCVSPSIQRAILQQTGEHALQYVSPPNIACHVGASVLPHASHLRDTFF